LDKYIAIGIGAVLGAYCRHWVGVFSVQRWGAGFPWGTLIVNLAGSFVLGLFLALHLNRGLFPASARYFVAIGWCASFTTFSTFSWETLLYLQEGNTGMAGLNVAANLFGCLLATWGGLLIAKSF
jgi:fluoride exporter